MDEKLPIKFFSKREEDNQRVEGGGNQNLPKWILEGSELIEKSQKLSNSIENILNNEKWENRVVPIVIEAKLSEDALAKSHRKKIQDIFFTTKNNVIGISKKATLIIRVDSEEQGRKIKENMLNTEDNFYGLSGIENVMKYTPIIEEDNKTSNYKVKLFNFNEFSTNKTNQLNFEKFLIDKNIKYEKKDYAKSLIIYKLQNISQSVLDEIKNNSIFDLTEEFIPMPSISLELDALSIEKKIYNKTYDEINKSEIVGVLDNGIIPISPLKNLIYDERKSPYPDEYILGTHGTFIAGIITYGDELHGKELVGAKNIRVFDAAIYPNPQKEIIEEDELIENIREIIKNNHEKIKIWNLSISIAREISEEKFSDFAIALDDIQDQYNILICKSAGNCTNFVNSKDLGRLNEGADSIRALVVGSIASEQKRYELSSPDNPSPFSRRGPGPAFVIKPEIVHYGGNAGVNPVGNIVQSGVKSFSREGNIIENAGTSFSTPRVAALAAGLSNEMAEEFDPLLLKALIIHSAKYSENLEVPEFERTKYLGFGLPDNVHNILYNSPNEATLILRDVLPKGKFIDIKDFPMPDCLIKNGFFNFQAIVTLVYDPILDPTQGFEYCQSNIDVKFGSYDEKVPRDTSKNCILNPIGRSGAQNILTSSLYSKTKMKASSKDFALKERMQIQYGDKYYPVKKYAVDTSELTDGNRQKFATSNKKWFLKLENTYRTNIEEKSFYENRELSQDFCLIITIKDSEHSSNVYNGVTQKLIEYNFWHSNIKISENININI